MKLSCCNNREIHRPDALDEEDFEKSSNPPG
jgi:hypothetical protein